MKSLLKDTLIYGASTVLSRGAALLVLPVYTRILTPAEYGVLEMITVAASLVMLVVPMEIGQALTRFYSDAEPGHGRRVVSGTTLWFGVVAYVAFLAVAWAGAGPLSRVLLGTGMETPFKLGALHAAAAGMFTLIQYQLRVELRSRAYAVVSLLYSFATVGLGVLLGYAFGLALNGILVAQSLGALIAILAGAGFLAGSYSLKIDKATLRHLLGFSLPLVPSGLATFLTLQVNRLMLGSMIGLQAIGIFGVASRVAGIVSLAVVGLQAALTPLIYAHYKEPQTPARLARIFEGFSALALVCCLGLGLFASEIVGLLAEARYAEAATYVMVLAPATLLNQFQVFFPGIAISRKMHLQLWIFMATAASSVLANWLLIRHFGVTGAVTATLVVGIIFMLMWVAVSQRLYPIPVRWARIFLACSAFTVLVLAGQLVKQGDQSIVRDVAARVALLCVFGIIVWWGLGRHLWQTYWHGTSRNVTGPGD